MESKELAYHLDDKPGPPYAFTTLISLQYIYWNLKVFRKKPSPQLEDIENKTFAMVSRQIQKNILTY